MFNPQDDDGEVRAAGLSAMGSSRQTLTALEMIYEKLSRSPQPNFLRHLSSILDLYIARDVEEDPLDLLSFVYDGGDLTGLQPHISGRGHVQPAVEAERIDSGRIFDEEDDNLYAEDALQTQIALVSVHSIGLRAAGAEKFLLHCLEQLHVALRAIDTSDAKGEHLMGAAQHPLVFRAVYILVLRVSAVAALVSSPLADSMRDKVCIYTLEMETQSSHGGIRRQGNRYLKIWNLTASIAPLLPHFSAARSNTPSTQFSLPLCIYNSILHLLMPSNPWP